MQTLGPWESLQNQPAWARRDILTGEYVLFVNEVIRYSGDDLYNPPGYREIEFNYYFKDEPTHELGVDIEYQEACEMADIVARARGIFLQDVVPTPRVRSRFAREDVI